MPDEIKKIGRLAMRVEGTMWNAYYAMPNTIDDAMLLGSIRMRLVEHNPERRQVFIELDDESCGRFTGGAFR